MTDQPLPSIFELTPLNDRFRVDPHVLLDDLRARCPAHKDPTSGSVLLSRYADVRAQVNDLTLWRDPLKAEEGALINRALVQDVDPNLPRTSTTSILMLDDPDHARVRQPLAQALYARVAKCRRQVEEIVDAALDDLPTGEPFDLMDRFCVPIPIDVIASILGVDHSRLGE
ncbi:MAG: hypothetical protein Q8S13_07975, partial [Dehalococcoidia bacterium]|nr:hypothetical protein [Dehalococcoidia bacterium]